MQSSQCKTITSAYMIIKSNTKLYHTTHCRLLLSNTNNPVLYAITWKHKSIADTPHYPGFRQMIKLLGKKISASY